MRPLTTTLACLALAVLTSGCEVCTLPNGNARVIVDLGVDADLHALDSHGGRFLAAGSEGTIVAWGTDHTRPDPLTSVHRFDLGDSDLRAVLITSPYQSPTSYWVVGDAGTVALSNNYGVTWSVATLASVDLHAIIDYDGRPIIAGDEIVLVRSFDGTWSEPPTPPGGWGSLRGLGFDGERVHAVGLGGVAWSTSDPSGEWIAEPTGVDVDLLDLCAHYVLIAVGATGTVLVRESKGWVERETGIAADLIDCGGRVLAADGVIYRFDVDGGLIREDEEFPGALTVRSSYVVGEGGLATAPARLGCE